MTEPICTCGTGRYCKVHKTYRTKGRETSRRAHNGKRRAGRLPRESA